MVEGRCTGTKPPRSLGFGTGGSAEQKSQLQWASKLGWPRLESGGYNTLLISNTNFPPSYLVAIRKLEHFIDPSPYFSKRSPTTLPDTFKSSHPNSHAFLSTQEFGLRESYCIEPIPIPFCTTSIPFNPPQYLTITLRRHTIRPWATFSIFPCLYSEPLCDLEGDFVTTGHSEPLKGCAYQSIFPPSITSATLDLKLAWLTPFCKTCPAALINPFRRHVRGCVGVSIRCNATMDRLGMQVTLMPDSLYGQEDS